jgi:tetratricopeptide (TPR) repeat protein
MRQWLLGLGIAAGILVSVCANSFEENDIKALYRRGLAGDKQAVEECIAKLEVVSKREPSDQLARVYLGSALTLRSRDLPFGPKKLQALRQGLALMDEAVESAPNEPKVRLARALTTSALPSIFGRAKESRTDFKLLATDADTTPRKFDRDDLPTIYYNAGLAAKNSGAREDARRLWQRGLETDPDAALREKLRAELAQ